MLSINPFSILAESIAPIAMQSFIIGNKDNMPEMPWKRLYQSKGINRESSGNHTSVSEL